MNASPSKILFIGVVGSRRRNTDSDYTIVIEAVVEVIESNPDFINYTLVSGGCPLGADSFVNAITDELGLHKPLIHWPDRSSIDPKKHPRWEYARICFDRNTLIARDSDILVACVAADRLGGTEDTIKKFKKIHKERLLRDNTILVELLEGVENESEVKLV